MNIVLVHGFLNRGGILATLARRLTDAGHTCHTPSLRPCDARHGLPALAEQLEQLIAKTISPEARIAVVGFSMGAVVSRYYLQELGGGLRTDAFFSIAGPHRGTRSAYLYPGLGALQMRPNSPFLRTMAEHAGAMAKTPVTCYWTPFDLMIRPIESARMAGAEQVRILAPIHSLLVFNRKLSTDIERRLAALQAEAV